MKKAVSIATAFLVSIFNCAQTFNVHKTNGEVIRISLTELDYVDFSEDKTLAGPPASVEAIDLGFPSGTKWANMNVGATKPEEYGGYYAWGETEEKGIYSEETWHDDEGLRMTNYPSSYRGIAYSNFDVAHIRWGNTWHLPTYDQLRELIDNCNALWTTLNGVYGYELTSKLNGKKLFLPAAGHKIFNGLKNEGKECSYLQSANSGWGNSESGSYIYPFLAIHSTGNAYYGRTVRAVME